MYIDPGTGSMLFTILVGTIGAGSYALRDRLVKLRFYLSGGRAEKNSGDAPDYAIFSDSKRYWNVFEPICDEFEKRETEIVYMTASEDDPALKRDYKHVKCEFIGEGNKAYAKLNSLKADIVLSTTPSLDVFYWKRSKGVKWYVHIPHAADDLTKYRMFGIDYYDAILTSGDFQIEELRKLEKIRKLPEKEMLNVGLTYLDTMKARLEKTGSRAAAGRAKKDINVLLAPSWGPSSIFNRFGSEMIDSLLKTDYHIIIRPHPQSYTSEKEMLDRLMAKYPENDRLEWNKDNDNFDVLNRSDILISDFSGVVYDFSLVFDKPIIYADVSFDASPYDACWLDEQPWSLATLEKIGTQLTKENIGNIGDVIDSCINDERFRQGREQARKEAWGCPGQSAVLVTDYLMAKHAELEAAAKAREEELAQMQKQKQSKKKDKKKDSKTDNKTDKKTA